MFFLIQADDIGIKDSQFELTYRSMRLSQIARLTLLFFTRVKLVILPTLRVVTR